MANKKNCCSDNQEIRVETLTLDDGRRAERHVTNDDNGNQVVEIFAEEKRPLKLEKRIVREYKNIVSKETHQTVKDGEVAYEEVHSSEPEVPLQLRQRIGMADHAKIVDGDYVRKDEIDRLIADGVVQGVTALMEHMEPVQQLQVRQPAQQPVFKAQEAVEKTVDDKKKSDVVITVIMGVIVLAQAAFFGYIFFM